MYPGKRDGFKGRWMDGPDINEEKDAQKDELRMDSWTEILDTNRKSETTSRR